jgi:hypothetical protein
LRGFALAWNADLTLLQVLDSDFFRLNGYAIFRNSDVKRWRSVPKADFVARAVRLQKVRPSKPEAVEIGSMKEALGSAGTAFSLITIHRERIERGVCHVVNFLRTNQRGMTM